MTRVKDELTDLVWCDAIYEGPTYGTEGIIIDRPKTREQRGHYFAWLSEDPLEGDTVHYIKIDSSNLLGVLEGEDEKFAVLGGPKLQGKGRLSKGLKHHQILGKLYRC